MNATTDKTTDKKKKAKKAKPLRRAKRFGREVPGLAFKLAVTLIAVIVLNLMFSALQALETPWLRIALSLGIASGLLLFYFTEGLNKGVHDAVASRRYEDLEARGIAMSAKEDAACYHPLKALCAAACVFALPLAAAMYLGVAAEEYTYIMQDLPTWLTGSYSGRSDVMAPLGAYGATQTLAVTDWLRIAVRLPLMIFINLFSDPLRMSAAIDRLSAAGVALYPLAFMLGYLRAPASEHKLALQNRRAKKVAARKAQKKTLVQELVGEQHGGHQAPQRRKEHKKKELV